MFSESNLKVPGALFFDSAFLRTAFLFREGDLFPAQNLRLIFFADVLCS